MVAEGQLFPDFVLKDQDGNTVTRQDIAGAHAVVYFYPKDDTSGCTKEACEFRDAMPQFKGVRVIGVSPDSEASHKRFAGKYGLNFTLLADKDRALATAAGVWVEKSMYGKKYMGVERSTFLLDAEGRVVKAWQKVKPEGHAAAVLAATKGGQ
ncbi:MAG: thioredoxin-dependent thiol peroxidase [Fimbriimonadaceae bacterium]|nr:thioredoxin-dependent thiol peroxidase [Fimbriimonadaceae bacterium]QYK55401.1 MAG: thioredoxin-dependent thiol peroxidase [Fimbriimonadaceae bacterium]